MHSTCTCAPFIGVFVLVRKVWWFKRWVRFLLCWCMPPICRKSPLWEIRDLPNSVQRMLAVPQHPTPFPCSLFLAAWWLLHILGRRWKKDIRQHYSFSHTFMCEANDFIFSPVLRVSHYANNGLHNEPEVHFARNWQEKGFSNIPVHRGYYRSPLLLTATDPFLGPLDTAAHAGVFVGSWFQQCLCSFLWLHAPVQHVKQYS